MNYTSNYQLNQWAKSDQVRMEDFNADNDKIDAAIKAIQEAIPYVKLKEVTVGSNTASVDVDVSGIDFLDYRRVELYCSCASPDSTVSVQVNGQTKDYSYGGTSGGGSAYGKTTILGVLGNMMLLYTPVRGAKVGCAYFTGNGYSFGGQQITADCTWEDLNSIQFSKYGGIPAGTKITIYGLKK